MSDALLAPLNEAQRQAVLHFEGPALVVAGAGSGKTRTVVHRVAYLVARRGVFPSEILAVTFTNKAAEEMRERLRGLVPGAGEVWVSTFHAAALRILRVYGERVGLRPGFVVYDEDDQTALLKEVLKELALSARPGRRTGAWALRPSSASFPSTTPGFPGEGLGTSWCATRRPLRPRGPWTSGTSSSTP